MIVAVIHLAHVAWLVAFVVLILLAGRLFGSSPRRDRRYE